MGNTNQVPEIEPYELQHIQDLSEEWIKIPITGLRDPPKTPGDRPGPPFKPDSMVLMDDYLIIFGFEDRRCSQYFEMDSKNEVLKGKERPRKHIPFVLAVDLRDRSIQHVRLEDWEEKCPTYVGYSIRYKLHKCSEKEILVFDTCDRYCCFQLSIESFQLKSKRLKIGKEEKSSNENVEISQDCFYIVDFESKTGKNLWCLDMEKKAWKTYKTVGETLGKKTMHFVFKDDLYAYNSNSKICILDSDTMEWKRCFQRKVDRHLVQLTGDIYNDHLMILSREQQYTRSEGKNQFHCWDINTNSWKVFNIQSPGPYLLFNQLIVYKNSLWAIGNCQELDIHLVTYNLEGKGVRSLSLIFIDLGFEASISFEEQQRFKRLFMNEESSDVKFKLQEKTIPAHKEVLIKRSRFFAGLFRSGMAETKQGVIEITDCDWTIFQAFLRFLYCDKIKLDDKLLTFKLFDFADKYAQHDLKKRCFVYLKLNIDPLTALEIFIEARGREMNDLLNWCIEYFENNGVGLANISELMKYLINNPHKELRAKIFDWIMVNYSMIYENQKESLGICEEFLMNNIEMENLARISQFVAENERFEKEMVKLEDAMYRFGAENWGKLPSKGCAQGFTMNVLKFKLKMNEKANGRKRMEPGKKNDKTAENPQLKKTKKSNKSRK